jgi:hypothetical protein
MRRRLPVPASSASGATRTPSPPPSHLNAPRQGPLGSVVSSRTRSLGFLCVCACDLLSPEMCSLGWQGSVGVRGTPSPTLRVLSQCGYTVVLFSLISGHYRLPRPRKIRLANAEKSSFVLAVFKNGCCHQVGGGVQRMCSEL